MTATQERGARGSAADVPFVDAAAVLDAGTDRGGVVHIVRVAEPAIGASLTVRRDHARLPEDMFARWLSNRAGSLAIRTGAVKA